MSDLRYCPFCGSERLYTLMGTLRCMRCKGIWKAGEPVPGLSDAGTTRATRKPSEPLEKRMERQLDTILARHGGRFCSTGIAGLAGDIPPELFTRYLKRCVQERALGVSRDRYGRTWYSRP